MMRRAIVVLLAAVTSAALAAGSGTVKGTITIGAEPAADAVVLVDVPEPAPVGTPGRATMDQRNEAFVPRVLVVRTGTTVDFPNHDAVLHNVSSASRAKPFDLGMFPRGETRSVTFDTPGVVEIRCHVHPRMSAFIVVHSGPSAAVTDARGSYTIADVPPGSYGVRVWHESTGERPATVTVRENVVQPLDVRLEPRR